MKKVLKIFIIVVVCLSAFTVWKYVEAKKAWNRFTWYEIKATAQKVVQRKLELKVKVAEKNEVEKKAMSKREMSTASTEKSMDKMYDVGKGIHPPPNPMPRSDEEIQRENAAREEFRQLLEDAKKERETAKKEKENADKELRTYKQENTKMYLGFGSTIFGSFVTIILAWINRKKT
jgi:uncharacterized membrane protein